MQITITITMKPAAERPKAEVARILCDAAVKIAAELPSLDGFALPVRDVIGNRIGWLRVAASELAEAV